MVYMVNSVLLLSENAITLSIKNAMPNSLTTYNTKPVIPSPFLLQVLNKNYLKY